MTASTNLNAGRIAGVFGLRGECKIDATRLGADALGVGAVVELTLPNGSRRELRIRAARIHKGRPLVSFEGCDDIDSAQALVGATIALDRDAVVLGPGEFLDADLIGCAVVDLGGAVLADVVGVEHYPAQDMLVVGSARALIPMVGAFVKSIDVAARRIVVDLPAGLLDEREAESG